MKTTKRLTILALLLSILTLTGCADAVSFSAAVSVAPVGFLHGLWHGLILPFAFIISLFDSDVAVYAIYNSGGWCDFGFILGVGGLASHGK